MKYVSFLLASGSSYGLVKGDHVLDLGALMGADAPDLKSFIARGLLPQAATLAERHEATLPLARLRLLPVIPNPGKIVCIGLNYHEHVVETQRTVTESP